MVSFGKLRQLKNEANTFLRDIGALDRKSLKERVVYKMKDRYQIPLFIGILLILIEMLISLRGSLRAVILLLCLGSSFNAYAIGDYDSYLENEKGLKKLEEEKVDEARKHFNNAQAQDPNRPELFYNQGVINLKQGATEQAVNQFGIASQKSLEQGNEELAAKSFYNLGSALEANGQIDEAIMSQFKAIDVAKKSKNLEIEQEARKKIESLIQKKQQQSQGKSKQQSKSNQDDQDQQKKKDEDDGSGKDKNKNPNYNQNKRQEKFKSQSLRKEDAERVMSELSNKDKKLQKKLKKQKGRRSNDGRDW